jgi:hypothetical protein
VHGNHRSVDDRYLFGLLSMALNMVVVPAAYFRFRKE